MILKKHYIEVDTFERELRTIFLPRFFVGTDFDFLQKDSYYSFFIGKEHALTCRKVGRRLKAFSNVCLHRNCLIDPLGAGQRRFRCGYHGWQYDEEGELCRSPGFDLQKVQCKKLIQYKTSSSMGLNFTGGEVDPEVSEAGVLMNNLGLILSQAPFHSGEIEHQCNWKLLVENVLDREHVGQVHGSSFVPAGIDSSAPVLADGADYTLWSRIQPKDSPVSRSLKHFKGAAHHYLHGYVFPNLFLANTNNLIGFVNQLIPVTVNQSLLRWQLYELPALLAQPKAVRDKIKQDATVLAERILREDKQIVEMCQKGLAAYGAELQFQEQEEQILRFHAMYSRAGT